MTTALLLTVIWVLVVGIRFRRSIRVLLGGLLTISTFTLAALACGALNPDDLGLDSSVGWGATLLWAVAWCILMLLYSPLADWLASRCVAEPPTLEAFRPIQESRAKLIAGIAVAWLLGAFLEELVFRGVVVQAIVALLAPWLPGELAAAVAVVAAAAGAGVVHLYQGWRAALIITQLSVLFGTLFVISGPNLWAVILCHGLYDTMAFVRFATKSSKYSKLEPSNHR